jgi:GTP cyclohydrolase I
MKDIQNEQPNVSLFINKVGVKNVEFPLTLETKDSEKITVHAHFDLFASLSRNIKGTNMSRFLEHLMEYNGAAINPDNFPDILKRLASKMEADDVYIVAGFNYPCYVKSPVSQKQSIYYANCKFFGELSRNDYKFETEVSAI